MSSQLTGSGSEETTAGEYGANEWLVDEMYEKYLADPDSVDKTGWPVLEHYRQVRTGALEGALNGQTDAASPTSADAPAAPAAPTSEAAAPAAPASEAPAPAAAPAASTPAAPAPIAAEHGIGVTTDDRVLESVNRFEGERINAGPAAFAHPRHWPKLVNPFKPSWGEAYELVAERMLAAIHDARQAAEGHEAVIVSHQLPIWTARNKLMGRRLWHDPRHRQCSLASLTTLTYQEDELESVTYSEPASALLPQAHKGAGA